MAVHDLDLDVPPGELYGFLGPNGAGKTTTIRMLTGLLRPTRGEVRLMGMTYDRDASRIRAATGLVPDTPPLYEHLTGRQYIGFVASLYGVRASDRDREADRFLSLFELEDRADSLCKGYSHGMRKKLHIAAVLVTRPRILFLDEPTSGLDPRSARTLKDVLLEERDGGTTIFLSTHLLATAQEICDRVGILVDGTLRAEGSLAELRGSSGDGSLEEVFLRMTDGADESPAAR